MTRIYISYRRDDAAWEAGRIYERLTKSFLEKEIFFDISSIKSGENFANKIREDVSDANVCLVIIGEKWVNISNSNGDKRLYDPDDYVRLEIRLALEKGKKIIPVLIRGTVMPKSEELPADIQQLSQINGVRLRHTEFSRDMDKLIEAIGERTVQEQTGNRNLCIFDFVHFATKFPEYLWLFVNDYEQQAYIEMMKRSARFVLDSNHYQSFEQSIERLLEYWYRRHDSPKELYPNNPHLNELSFIVKRTVQDFEYELVGKDHEIFRLGELTAIWDILASRYTGLDDFPDRQLPNSITENLIKHLSHISVSDDLEQTIRQEINAYNSNIMSDDFATVSKAHHIPHQVYTLIRDLIRDL